MKDTGFDFTDSNCFFFDCLFNPKLNEINPWITYDLSVSTSKTSSGKTTFFYLSASSNTAHPKSPTAHSELENVVSLGGGSYLAHDDNYYMTNDGGEIGGGQMRERKSGAVRKWESTYLDPIYRVEIGSKI